MPEISFPSKPPSYHFSSLGGRDVCTSLPFQQGSFVRRQSCFCLAASLGRTRCSDPVCKEAAWRNGLDPNQWRAPSLDHALSYSVVFTEDLKKATRVSSLFLAFCVKNLSRWCHVITGSDSGAVSCLQSHPLLGQCDALNGHTSFPSNLGFPELLRKFFHFSTESKLIAHLIKLGFIFVFSFPCLLMCPSFHSEQAGWLTKQLSPEFTILTTPDSREIFL